MNILEKPIYDLMISEPFFANFLLGSRIIFDDPKVPTAGACIQRSQVTFLFNTDFMNTLTRAEKVAVLKHEVFHVLLEHCGVRGEDPKNRMAKNYAMDCAINQHIEGLPKDSVTLDSLSKMCKLSLYPNEPWEYYFEHMLKVIQKNEDKGGNKKLEDQEPRHDQMEGGEELGEEMSEAQKALNRAVVKDHANKALAASAGKIPNGLSSILSKISAGAQLPWKQILRNFVAKARHINTKPTRLKPHRRFDLDQPGKKKLKRLVLGVCTDSSGSVSDEAYMQFMKEISIIAQSTTITYLVHADCEVQKVDIIKGGKAKGDVLTQRHGHGGTAYQPAIDHCKKLNCDAIIYFGDFDCADTPSDPHIPFLWVGVGSQEAPGKFGQVLRLT